MLTACYNQMDGVSNTTQLNMNIKLDTLNMGYFFKTMGQYLYKINLEIILYCKYTTLLFANLMGGLVKYRKIGGKP